MDGEKLLCRPPVLHDFSDSVTDKKSGFRAIDRRDKDGIQRACSALDRVARNLYARDLLPAAKTSQESVAKSKGTADERHSDGEDPVLHASRERTSSRFRDTCHIHDPTHDNTAELRRVRLARLLDS